MVERLLDMQGTKARFLHRVPFKKVASVNWFCYHQSLGNGYSNYYSSCQEAQVHSVHFPFEGVYSNQTMNADFAGSSPAFLARLGCDGMVYVPLKHNTLFNFSLENHSRHHRLPMHC